MGIVEIKGEFTHHLCQFRFSTSQERSLQLVLVRVAWPVLSVTETGGDCNCNCKTEHYKNTDRL